MAPATDARADAPDAARGTALTAFRSAMSTKICDTGATRDGDSPGCAAAQG